MEIDHNKLLNWLGSFGIPLYHIHASGHLNPHELRELVSEISPKKVFIMRSDRPKLTASYMRGLNTEMVTPEEGKPYPLR
jgi:mRNA degradation ribonuclease J1/J2